MKTTTAIIEIDKLHPTLEDGMFRLLDSYFDGVDRKRFENDLREKRWAVILMDDDSKIHGFSTLTILETVVDGRDVKAFYSGDTIIATGARKMFSLEREWLPFVFARALAEPRRDWYWFLISKGFRTFKYLPVYFKSFWPSPDADTPCGERKILDALASTKFGGDYDPRTGVVSISGDYALKNAYSEIVESEKNKKFARFFAKKNPEWQCGAQLACLAKLTLDNLSPVARKLVDARRSAERGPGLTPGTFPTSSATPR